ncbi:hypothetical protein JG688_00011034 [Phytophthora aleatoria]|uniref:DDE-1 domain-containing protein n=1 Tax=Phytophthora aleatoria TaxID=2496075 RepID=A0A8J5J109_9STRA|nr:hypothetical protein JG688_00011034 [Phytophthora aleatoria]
MSRIVAQAWDAIPAKVIVNGFIKSGLIPIGPRDRVGRFRIPQVLAGDAPVVCGDSEQSKKYIARFFVWIIHNMQNVCSTQLGCHQNGAVVFMMFLQSVAVRPYFTVWYIKKVPLLGHLGHNFRILGHPGQRTIQA